MPTDPEGAVVIYEEIVVMNRPFDEALLFRAGQIIEDAAGRFVPQKWW